MVARPFGAQRCSRDFLDASHIIAHPLTRTTTERAAERRPTVYKLVFDRWVPVSATRRVNNMFGCAEADARGGSCAIGGGADAPGHVRRPDSTTHRPRRRPRTRSRPDRSSPPAPPHRERRLPPPRADPSPETHAGGPRARRVRDARGFQSRPHARHRRRLARVPSPRLPRRDRPAVELPDGRPEPIRLQTSHSRAKTERSRRGRAPAHHVRHRRANQRRACREGGPPRAPRAEATRRVSSGGGCGGGCEESQSRKRAANATGRVLGDAVHARASRCETRHGRRVSREGRRGGGGGGGDDDSSARPRHGDHDDHEAGGWGGYRDHHQNARGGVDGEDRRER